MANQKNSESFPFLLTVAVVGTVIGTLIAAYFVSDSFSHFVHFILHGLRVAIVWFFTTSYSLPLWLITVLVIMSLWFVAAIVADNQQRKLMESEEYKTSPSHYVTDTFDGVVWTWRFLGNQPIRLSCSCHDGTPLVWVSDVVDQPNFRRLEMVWLRCETCGFEGKKEFGNDPSVIEEKVVRQIIRKIKSGEYLKLIDKKKPS